jgi:hypothetical protein
MKKRGQENTMRYFYLFFAFFIFLFFFTLVMTSDGNRALSPGENGSSGGGEILESPEDSGTGRFIFSAVLLVLSIMILGVAFGLFHYLSK